MVVMVWDFVVGHPPRRVSLDMTIIRYVRFSWVPLRSILFCVFLVVSLFKLLFYLHSLRPIDDDDCTQLIE